MRKLVTGGLLSGGLAFAGPSAQAATNAPRVNAAWTAYYFGTGAIK